MANWYTRDSNISAANWKAHDSETSGNVDVEVITNSPDALALTGETATVNASTKIGCNTHALVITANTAEIIFDVNVQANLDTLAIAYYITDVAQHFHIETDTDTLAIAVYAATQEFDVEVLQLAAALTLATNSAQIGLGISITTDAPHALSLSEQTATINAEYNLTTNAPDALLISTTQADVNLNVTLDVNAVVALVLTENQATVNAGTNINANIPDALIINEYQATVNAELNLTTNIPDALIIDSSSNADVNLNVTLDAGTDELLIDIVRAKSVVFDIADSHGGVSYIAVRSIEFYLNDDLVTISNANASFYATRDWVAVLGEVEHAFITGESKSGPEPGYGVAWISGNGSTHLPNRLIIVFDAEVDFNRIVINNSHNSGVATDTGIKSTVITHTLEDYSNTVFEAAITNGTEIFDGIVAQQAGINGADDQDVAIDIQLSATVKYDVGVDATTGALDIVTYQSQIEYDINVDSITGALDIVTYQATARLEDVEVLADTDALVISGKTATINAAYGLTTNAPDALVVAGQAVTLTFDVGVNPNTKALTLTENQATLENDIYVVTNAPDALVVATYDVTLTFDAIINASTNERFISGPDGFTAKSVIFDVADNWGNISNTGVRSIEFLDGDSVVIDIDLHVTPNATSYATTTQAGIDFHSKNAFDTSLSQIGAYTDREWISGDGGASNQRLIIVFDEPIFFTGIVINNSHNGLGGETDRGINNTKIYTAPDDITSTVYDEAIANSNLIFDGAIDEHIAANQVDDFDVIFISSASRATINAGLNITTNAPDALAVATYDADVNLNVTLDAITDELVLQGIPEYSNVKSVIIDIADNLGDADWVGIRQIDFFSGGSKITNNETLGSFYYTSQFSTQYRAALAFDTSTSKIDSMQFSGWYAAFGTTTNQRIICVFNSPTSFDEIQVNNAHQNGFSRLRGAENVKIHVSTDAITSTVYDEAIANSTLIFDSTFAEHIAANTADDQTIALTGATGSVGSGVASVATVNADISLTTGTPDALVIATYDATINLGVDIDAVTDTLDIVTYAADGNMAPVAITTNAPDALVVATYDADPNLDKVVTVGTDALILEGQVYSGVKSVILDFTDNWGDAGNMGLRTVEFMKDGEVITTSIANASFYETSALNPSYSAEVAFDTTYPHKIDGGSVGSWIATDKVNQRIICVFDALTEFDAIVINNYHNGGGTTTAGVRNTKIYTSTDAISSTVYDESIANSTLVFDSEVNEHIGLNEIDDDILALVGGTSSGIASVANINAETSVTTNAPDALVITGHDATAKADIVIDADFAALDIVTNQANIEYDINVLAGFEALDLVTNQADPNLDKVVDCSTDALDLVEYTADVEYDRNVEASTHALVIAHYQASADASVNVYTNAPDALVVATYDATIKADISLTTNSPDALVIAGQTVTIKVEAIKLAGYQALNIAKYQADINAELNIVTNAPDALVIATGDVTLTQNIDVAANVDTLVIAGQTATVNAEISITTGTPQALIVAGLDADPNLDKNVYTTHIALYSGYSRPEFSGVKSVIFDIADNYGNSSMAVRSIEFKNNGTLIPIDTEGVGQNATAYATSSMVAILDAAKAFDTSLSKIGSNLGTEWQSALIKIEQRLIIVFDSPVTFDEIVINNSNTYATGGGYTKGIKDTKITISTDAITSTVYNEAISNSTVIFDEVHPNAIQSHVTIDDIDDDEINLGWWWYPATINAEANILAETGVLVISGETALLKADTIVDATTQALVISGKTATVNAEVHVTTGSPDALVIVGQDADPNLDKVVDSGTPQALIISGKTAEIVEDINVLAGYDELIIQGRQSSLTASAHIYADGIDTLDLVEYPVDANLAPISITTNAPQALIVATYDADPNLDKVVDATTQALVIATYDATIKFDAVINPDTDALVIATYDVTLTFDAVINPDTGALVISGKTADLSAGVEIVTNAPDALVVVGKTAEIVEDINVLVETGALDVVGKTAEIVEDINVLAGTHALDIATYDITITRNAQVITTAPHALVVAGQTATVNAEISITTNAPDALVIAGKTATVNAEISITTNAPDALEITTYAPYRIAYDINVNAGYQELAVLGIQATTSHDDNVYTTSVAMVVSGKTADIGGNVTINAETQALLISGKTATVNRETTIVTGTPQALVISGKTAVTKEDTNVQVGSKALVIQEYDADPNLNKLVSAGTHALTIATYAPDIGGSVTVEAGTDALSIVTYDVTLTFDVELSTNAPHALVITGKTVGLSAGIDITTNSPDALLIDGKTADINLNSTVDTTTDALVVDGLTATINLNQITDAGTDTLVIATYDVTLTFDAVVNAGVDTLVISGKTAVLTGNREVFASTAVLLISPLEVNLTTHTTVATTPDGLVVAEQTPNINAEISLIPDYRPLTIATYPADPNLNKLVSASRDTLVIASYASDIKFDTGVNADTHALVITEWVAQLQNDVYVVADTDALDITTYQSVVVFNTTLTTNVDTLVIDGLTSQVNRETTVVTGAPDNLVVATYKVSFGTPLEIITNAPQALIIVENQATVAYDENYFIFCNAPQALVIATYECLIEAYGNIPEIRYVFTRQEVQTEYIREEVDAEFDRREEQKLFTLTIQ